MSTARWAPLAREHRGQWWRGTSVKRKPAMTRQAPPQQPRPRHLTCNGRSRKFSIRSPTVPHSNNIIGVGTGSSVEHQLAPVRRYLPSRSSSAASCTTKPVASVRTSCSSSWAMLQRSRSRDRRKSAQRRRERSHQRRAAERCPC